MADHNGHSGPANSEEVWAILRELARSQQETDRRMQETDRQMQETDRRMQETDRQMQETDRRMQETDRQMQETDRRMQETDRQMQETDRRLRRLDDLFNGQWGKLMEALVEGDLVELLNERGIRVEHTATNLKRERGARRWEIDILAVNGDEVVVVEVKTTLKVRHVDHLVGLLRDLPELMPEYRTKQIYGAVAYLKADESSGSYAERQGLYVIRATGSSASIINREGFRPRRFGRHAAAAGRHE